MYFQIPGSRMDHFCLYLSSCDLGQVVGNSEFFKAIRIQRGVPKRWEGWCQFPSMPLGRRPVPQLPIIRSVSLLVSQQRCILTASNTKHRDKVIPCFNVCIFSECQFLSTGLQEISLHHTPSCQKLCKICQKIYYFFHTSFCNRGFLVNVREVLLPFSLNATCGKRHASPSATCLEKYF